MKKAFAIMAIMLLLGATASTQKPRPTNVDRANNLVSVLDSLGRGSEKLDASTAKFTQTLSRIDR